MQKKPEQQTQGAPQLTETLPQRENVFVINLNAKQEQGLNDKMNEVRNYLNDKNVKPKLPDLVDALAHDEASVHHMVVEKGEDKGEDLLAYPPAYLASSPIFVDAVFHVTDSEIRARLRHTKSKVEFRPDEVRQVIEILDEEKEEKEKDSASLSALRTVHSTLEKHNESTREQQKHKIVQSQTDYEDALNETLFPYTQKAQAALEIIAGIQGKSVDELPSDVKFKVAKMILSQLEVDSDLRDEVRNILLKAVGIKTKEITAEDELTPQLQRLAKEAKQIARSNPDLRFEQALQNLINMDPELQGFSQEDIQKAITELEEQEKEKRARNLREKINDLYVKIAITREKQPERIKPPYTAAELKVYIREQLEEDEDLMREFREYKSEMETILEELTDPTKRANYIQSTLLKTTDDDDYGISEYSIRRQISRLKQEGFHDDEIRRVALLKDVGENKKKARKILEEIFSVQPPDFLNKEGDNLEYVPTLQELREEITREKGPDEIEMKISRLEFEDKFNRLHRRRWKLQIEKMMNKTMLRRSAASGLIFLSLIIGGGSILAGTGIGALAASGLLSYGIYLRRIKGEKMLQAKKYLLEKEREIKKLKNLKDQKDQLHTIFNSAMAFLRGEEINPEMYVLMEILGIKFGETSPKDVLNIIEEWTNDMRQQAKKAIQLSEAALRQLTGNSSVQAIAA